MGIDAGSDHGYWKPASNFFGRQREMETLQTSLDNAFGGHGSMAMLVGEAGIGKTRIAQEFSVLARQRGTIVLSGSCFEGDWQPPYGPWVEVLREYVRLRDHERLQREMSVSAAPLARLVPEVRAVFPNASTPTTLTPDEERFRLYDAVIQLLLAVAKETPILLVLDDLHWADRDSLRVLRHLARFVGNARLMIIGICRDSQSNHDSQYSLPDVLATLQREIRLQSIVIHGLGYEEVAEYLAHEAEQALPQALVRAVYSETDGNPFYVREVFRHLREEGKIVWREGRWSTDFSIEQLGIPESVRQVIGRRVARVCSETRNLLRLASCFAGSFSFEVIQVLTRQSEEALLNCLDEAIEAGIIQVVEGRPPGYDFSHAIVRHTLYDGLNPDRRARLHCRIADVLERVYGDGEMKHAAEIAAQYYASADLPGSSKGIPYALAAAKQARASYAHDRTVAFLKMARDLSIESEPAIRADILCNLAVAEAEVLLLAEARQMADEAVASLSATGAEPHAQASFLAQISRALKDGGAAPSIWMSLVEHGLALLGQQHDLLWARLMLLRDPYELVPLGKINAMRWLGHNPEAVAIARERGDEDDYARTLDPLEWRSPEQSSALLALVRTWHRPPAILRALDVVGRDLLKRHGLHNAAAEVYRELLETSERYGSIQGQAEALLQLAIIQITLGELSLAKQTARRMKEMVLRLGPAHELRFAVAALASLFNYFLDGDWSEPTAMAARFAAGSEMGWNPRSLVAGAYAALGYARMGNETESKQLLALLTPVIEQMDPSMYVHHAAIAFGGSATWAIGAVEFAPSYRRMALDLIQAGFGDSTLSHELTIARMASLLGETEEARDYFGQARLKSEAIGLKPIQAIVDYDEARALVRAGSCEQARIRALIGAALTGFKALGMEGWAKRALDLRMSLARSRVIERSGGQAYPDGLTAREIEVLRLLSKGKTNKEIGDELVIAVGTVERHIANIYAKIDVRGRAEATAYALSHVLIQPPSPKSPTFLP